MGRLCFPNARWAVQPFVERKNFFSVDFSETTFDEQTNPHNSGVFNKHAVRLLYCIMRLCQVQKSEWGKEKCVQNTV